MPSFARPGEREGLPAERGQERGVADQRDRLAGPEQPEVAVAERVQEARARDRGGRRGRDRLHIAKAILRPCPTGSASRASRCRAAPTRPRTSSAPSSSSRARPRPARTSSSCPEKWNAIGDVEHAARGGRAARGRRVGRGDRGLGAAGTGSRSSAARSRSAARAARSSRTRASSSTPTASSPPSTARSTSSTSRSAASVYRESEAEEPGDEPVVARGRGLAGRADGLLRPPLPRALPRPRARGRRARDRAGELHARDRQGPLARAAARAGDREPVLRRRGRAGRRGACPAGRATAARSSPTRGGSCSRGAGRGDGRHRRARPRPAAADPARRCRRSRAAARRRTGRLAPR